MHKTHKILLSIAVAVMLLTGTTFAWAGLGNGAWSTQQVNISLQKLMQIFNQGGTGSLMYFPAAQTPGVLAPGDNGQVLTLSAGLPTWADSGTADTGLTANSVPYVGTAGILSESAANLYFDPTANANFLRLGSGTAGGALRLLEGSGGGTNYTGFKAPSTLGGNIVYTLPSADGNIYDRLQTNASGTLSWAPSVIWTSNAANFTGVDGSSAQPVFEAANDTITLAANTTYLVQGQYYISTAGTTSHTFGLLFGGTATFTSSNIIYTCTNGATDVLSAASSFHSTTPGTVCVLTPATATATHHLVTFSGTIRTTNAGTLIPQYKWSATPGAAGVSAANNYIKLIPVGADTLAQAGGWS